MSVLALLTWFFAAGSSDYQRGVDALKAGEATTAQQHLEAATAAEPLLVEAHWELGWAYWLQGDFAAAAASWSTVQSLEPSHPEVGTWLPQAQERARLAGLSTAPGEVPLQASTKTLSFAAAGDTMMGTALRRGASGLAPNDGALIFDGVAPWLQAADVAFVNLEGPLADGLPQTKCSPGSKSCYAFSTPTRYAQALVDAGVDWASLANNHSMDLGPAGMTSSMATLDALGIAHAGQTGDVAIIERDGIRIGLIAAHSGSCCLNVNRPEEIAAAVADLDTRVDIVVLSFHGGAEGAAHRHVPGKLEIGYGERRGDVKAVARAAVDAGADLVLGHGPHVLRGMEVYKGRLVAYSLGNFVGYKQFGTQGGYGGTSVVLSAVLADNGVLVSAQLHPVALDSDGQPRPDPSGAAWTQVAELSAADFPQTGVKVGAEGQLSW
jgi:poly-gamma-glutamate capsule biosynthesis protein CapA/YwtB (metallophosphatase superfamily)